MRIIGKNGFSGSGGGISEAEKLAGFSAISGSCWALGKTPALHVFRLFLRLRRRVLRMTKMETATTARSMTTTMPPTAPPERPLGVSALEAEAFSEEGEGVTAVDDAVTGLVAWALETAGAADDKVFEGAAGPGELLLKELDDADELVALELADELMALADEMLVEDGWEEGVGWLVGADDGVDALVVAGPTKGMTSV